MKSCPTVLIAYFGILRSIDSTISSIEENLVLPLNELAHVIKMAHLFEVTEINNPRSSENLAVDFKPDALKLDFMETDIPNRFLGELDLNFISEHGDTWNDGFRSVKNLLHQLYSLKKIKSTIIAIKPQYVVFARPDLIYHTNIIQDFKRIVQSPSNTALLPNWQRFGGLNDRFAICDYTASLSYATRYDYVYDFLKHIRTPLNGERLLHYAFMRDFVKLGVSHVKASRCRANGVIKEESFSPFRNFGPRPFLRDTFFYYKNKVFNLTL